MTNDASIGHGADFLRSDTGASGGNFGTVGEVLDITPPAISRDAVESTHMGSPEGWREFIGGLKDGGEAQIEINFAPGSATATAFLNDINADAPGYYKIVFPDATEWGFSALATGLEPGIPIDDRMTATFTVKISGKPGFIN